ncbi:hypothetical protein [Butyrivibrio sp. AE3009]|uniref:hypothetical protein n=1 Tax=Butyrivibrio sp. AE3009 TaxID=1280666 RepID=UPI0003B6D728|nr:hypothetical protein [Butyrivibrio sp. AE3009]
MLDAEEGAYLYQGFNREITKEEFGQRISDNTLEEVLYKEHVKKGDVLLITPGTLHAIGGILLAEVQQSSKRRVAVCDCGKRRIYNRRRCRGPYHLGSVNKAKIVQVAGKAVCFFCVFMHFLFNFIKKILNVKRCVI